MAPGAELSSDVAVVGSGPAGVVAALELAAGGFDVVLVESGERRSLPSAQKLSDASSWDPGRHAPMAMATRRQVGGASAIWGGRCGPFDANDFEPRELVPNGAWPIRYADIETLFQRATGWLVCGRAVFDARRLGHLPRSIVAGLPNGDVRTSTFERQSRPSGFGRGHRARLPTDFGREYYARLKSSPRVRLLAGMTCTKVVVVPGQRRVDYLELTGRGGRGAKVRARRYVLACGGLETPRLLLASPGPDGCSIGDHSGHVGRWYMGQLEGIVAQVRFLTSPAATALGYERDIDGVYLRRQFSFSADARKRLGLPSVVAWAADPDLPARARLRSVLRTPARSLGRDRRSADRVDAESGARHAIVRNRRVPGSFAYSADNVHPLHYRGEHLPHRESCVTLARELDAVGMPRLAIDIRFSADDLAGVVRAHQHWDEYLREHGQGRLEYLHDDVASAVSASSVGGFHPSGTTRMSAAPEDGVLTPDLAVHGFEDLSVVSSSAFVTSGQAPPTFMVVVLALRLADKMRRELRSRRAVASPVL